MPSLDTVVPEVTKQIIEPISEQIAKRVLMILGVSQLFTNNFYMTSDDLKAGNFQDTENKKRTPTNRCDVVITPNYNPSSTAFENFKGKDTEAKATSNRWTFEDYPIFHDKRPGIFLFEMCVPCSVELSFTLKLKSIELADMVSTTLFSRSTATEREFYYSDVLFSYGFPDRLLYILYSLYKMQDDVKATMNFPDYLTFGSNSAIRLLVNRDDPENTKELIIERSNVRVLGQLTYTGDKPDPENINKVADRYSVNFTYTYQFAKPTLLKLNYPVMVDNKLIDYRFIKHPVSMSLGEGDRTFSEQAFNAYFRNINLKYPSYKHVKYPLYDDWQRGSLNYNKLNTTYPAIFTGLLSISIDPNTGAKSLSVDFKNEIFPLLSVEAAYAVEQVLRYDLDNNLNDIFKRSSIFDIEIFSNEALIDMKSLSLDQDLVLHINVEPNISKRYRIVIGQIAEIKRLNMEYIYFMLSQLESYLISLTLDNIDRYIGQFIHVNGELVELTSELANSLLGTDITIYNPNYYTNFLVRNIDYLTHNKYLDIKTDLFTSEKSIDFYKQYIQSALNTAGGYNYAPCRSIILGRYIIEVRRSR